MKGSVIRICVIVMVLASSAAGKDPKYSLEHNGRRRTYRVHTPPEYNDSIPLPLVITIHGYAGNAQIFKGTSQMNPKADQEGFIVVYPNGTGRPQTWNAGLCCGKARRKDIDDVGFISALIDTMICDYSIDTQRIFATGFSNGGMLSYRLACEIPERIAAIGPVAGGLVLPECEPIEPVPIIHIHARNDPIIKIQGGRLFRNRFLPVDSTLEEWAARFDCHNGPDSVWVSDGSALQQKWWNDQGMEIILWTTRKGTHTWPGGKGIPYPGSIKPTRAINATDAIWEFFQAHPRSIPVPQPLDSAPVESDSLDHRDEKGTQIENQ